MSRLRLAWRFLPRITHVLRTEGLAPLFGKVKRRLRTTPLRVERLPMLIALDAPYPPLALPCPAYSQVTVIIPVYGNLRYTYRCLESLERSSVAAPFDVILVDDCSMDETREVLSQVAGLNLIVNTSNLGFIRSCNAGAAAASGEYLLFLNNDTQVQPDWLDAIVRTFERFPDAGIVGSRLLYPDGRQQEAGAIVFSDGSAWNYGHLDEPFKPEYSYVREPDYISGAALAIRRDLFEQLGGFDEHFAPAYYEDADLAFRVRDAGYRVIYQPFSRVVHFEGVSAGTDEAAATGMKRFQSINRQKFVVRWGHVLASSGARGEALERQKERRVRRRAFVADVYMLTPDKESGSLRMLNLIEILQELGFKVTFAAVNLEAPQPYVSDLQQRGVEVLYRPYVKSVAKHLKVCGPLYDLVMLSRADAATALMGDALRFCSNARIVYDTVDLHFLREQRLATLTGDQAARAVAEHRRREELGLIQQADTTLVVSGIERELLRQQAPEADVRVVSNIHRIYGCRQTFAERTDILFIGAFAHPPNTDAVLWFCQEIFPLVLAEEPGIRCLLIGADPPMRVSALTSEHVRVLGYVPDVSPLLDGCRLSVAPLRYGAGVKGKINQSLAHGLPVVATSQGVEGMYLAHGESVLIADQPRQFADAVLRLYRDAALWEHLSRGGLAVMEAHFSFAAARRALTELVGP